MGEKRNFSAKREAIYKIITSTDVHPSAEWIYEQLKPEIPDLSLGTVYRNLSVFKTNGKIRSLGVFGGQERFDHDTTPHSHFVCEKCFSIENIPLSAGLAERSAYMRIERECGVKVMAHNFIFFGRCKKCLVNTEDQNSRFVRR